MRKTGIFFQRGGLTFRHYTTEKPTPAVYAMHSHKEFELIYIVSGNVNRVIEGRKYCLTSGDMVLIRPTLYHFGEMGDCAKYERYNLLIDLDQLPLESLSLLPENVEVINLSDNPIARDLFQKMDYYHQSAPEDVCCRVCSLLLNELFYNLSLQPHPIPENVTIISPMISQALQYISRNLFTLTGVQEVADALFVSESYLFRLFRKYLHQSPKKYIMDKRLFIAQQYISMGQKPSDICKKCGFHDYSAFYRNYTAFFGCTPSQGLVDPTQEPPNPAAYNLTKNQAQDTAD